MGRKAYVVSVGKKPGVYTDWLECKHEGCGDKGSTYNGYSSVEEAEMRYRSVVEKGQAKIVDQETGRKTPMAISSLHASSKRRRDDNSSDSDAAPEPGPSHSASAPPPQRPARSTFPVAQSASSPLPNPSSGRAHTQGAHRHGHSPTHSLTPEHRSPLPSSSNLRLDCPNNFPRERLRRSCDHGRTRHGDCRRYRCLPVCCCSCRCHSSDTAHIHPCSGGALPTNPSSSTDASASSPETGVTQYGPTLLATPPHSRSPSPDSSFDSTLSSPRTGETHTGPPRPRGRLRTPEHSPRGRAAGKRRVTVEDASPGATERSIEVASSPEPRSQRSVAPARPYSSRSSASASSYTNRSSFSFMGNFTNGSELRSSSEPIDITQPSVLRAHARAQTYEPQAGASFPPSLLSSSEDLESEEEAEDRSPSSYSSSPTSFVLQENPLRPVVGAPPRVTETAHSYLRSPAQLASLDLSHGIAFSAHASSTGPHIRRRVDREDKEASALFSPIQRVQISPNITVGRGPAAAYSRRGTPTRQNHHTPASANLTDRGSSRQLPRSFSTTTPPRIRESCSPVRPVDSTELSNSDRGPCDADDGFLSSGSSSCSWVTARSDLEICSSSASEGELPMGRRRVPLGRQSAIIDITTPSPPPSPAHTVACDELEEQGGDSQRTLVGAGVPYSTPVLLRSRTRTDLSAIETSQNELVPSFSGPISRLRRAEAGSSMTHLAPPPRHASLNSQEVRPLNSPQPWPLPPPARTSSLRREPQAERLSPRLLCSELSPPQLVEAVEPVPLSPQHIPTTAYPSLHDPRSPMARSTYLPSWGGKSAVYFGRPSPPAHAQVFSD